jgi:hypothetical protein
MLVVLAADNKTRSSSTMLKAKFNNIHEKCMETTDYCMRRVPTPMPTIVRAATAVEANLNDIAREMISKMKPKLSTHKGPLPRKSMHPNEMNEVD